jgi:tetratricopeptide (TPR) repeat protein
VGDDQLDAVVFERTLARGRAALATGGLAAAGPLLRQALAMWRGPALAAVDSPLIRAEAGRLDELRSAAWEECIDVELQLGAERDLVSELTGLVARYPLRERFRQQLMLALYRAGRQSDALEAYREARTRLHEQLGVEPGPGLDDLHQRILRRDPTLSHPAASAPSLVPGPPQAAHDSLPATAPPAQLPLDVSGFAGRRNDLGTLDAILADAREQPTAVVICVIAGTAGVGKTALAVHWAHQVRGSFPDGQLYVNLRGFDPSGSALEPGEAVRGFLDAIGVPPDRVPVDLAAQAGLYRSLLAGRRMLVLLDNARDVEQVRPLLPGAPGCLVIVTSRNQLTGLLAAEDARPLTLDVLSAKEARELLSRRLGAARVAAEPEAVDQIAASCARLPLALAIAAARAAARGGFPLTVLAEELRDVGRSLDALDCADAATDLRVMFSWSYRTLGTETARLFRLLGLHPGPHITVAAAASLAGMPGRPTRAMLAELARAHMVTERAPGVFGFHDLLRAHATELTHALDSADQRRAAESRMLDHYLHTASAADLRLDPHRSSCPLGQPLPGVSVEDFASHEQAHAWLMAEQPVLISATHQAVKSGFDTHAWQLAWTYADFLYWRGLWHDLAATNTAALAAARRTGSLAGQAHAHRGLAGATTSLGRHDDAYEHLRQALDLLIEVGDLVGQAQIHRNLAQVLEGQGRYTTALSHARQAHELCRSTSYRTGEARALAAIGWIHALLGDHQQALTCCQRALAVHRELGDSRGEADVWHSMGYAYHQGGEHGDAADCYGRALALLRRSGERSNEVITLIDLGDTYQAADDLQAARHAWQQALDIIDQFGDPNADKLRDRLQHAAPA